MLADPFPRLAARWLFAGAVLLSGCGPGTGGTGLPPAASTPGPAPTADAGPGTGAVTAPPPVAGTPVPAPPFAAAPTLGGQETGSNLPARTADLAGVVTAVDAETVVVAGTALPRAALRVSRPDGSAAPSDLLQPGVAVRVWRVGEVFLVRLET